MVKVGTAMVIEKHPEEAPMVIEKHPEEAAMVIEKHPEEAAMVIEKHPGEAAMVIEKHSGEAAMVIRHAYRKGGSGRGGRQTVSGISNCKGGSGESEPVAYNKLHEEPFYSKNICVESIQLG